MNRVFTWLNLCGVVVLGVLCIFQWRLNRQANLDAYRLEETRLQQTAQIAEQLKTIQGQTDDLQTFREQLTKVSALLKETETRLAKTEADLRGITGERDQLKMSVTNFAAAVAARDDQLKESAVKLQELAQARNDAIAKFNELAEKYNALVKELNEARSKAPK